MNWIRDDRWSCRGMRMYAGAALVVAAALPAQRDWMRARLLEGRSNAAMAYDSDRQRMVLFGGNLGSAGLFGDTWEWDGASWAHRSAAVVPPARTNHAMVYDAARRRVVLFGG